MRQRELLINALRMRPDRIIVGEVRGEEALDMLQAMNTGHDGSITTVHANTPRDAIARIETMSQMANLNLPEMAMRQQIAAAIHLIVQVSRMSDGSRRVTHITEITGTSDQVVSMQDIFLLREARPRPERQSAGTLLCDRHRAEVRRETAAGGHQLRPKLAQLFRGDLAANMFLTWLIFGGVALLTFAIIFGMTRPTAVERAVENRIAKLRDSLQIGTLFSDDAGPIIKVTRLSEIACFDSLLQKLKFARWLQSLIDQAQSSWSVPKVIGAAGALGLAGFIVTYCALPHASVAVVPALALATLPFLVLRFQKLRRFREFNRHLPEAIDLMSRALRAGHSLDGGD